MHNNTPFHHAPGTMGAAERDASAILLAGPGMTHPETVLATIAVAGAARAMRHALHGPEARPPWRWRLVAPAAGLRAPHLNRRLEASGLRQSAARALAGRLAPLIAAAPLDSFDPHQPVGLVDVRGVPTPEYPVLVSLGLLVVEAACALHTLPRIPGVGMVALVEPDDHPGAGPWAGLFAARLDHPCLSERAVRDALAAARDRLVAEHPGARDWLPPGAETTVALRSPAEHPSLPLAFAPFAVTSGATLRALNAKSGRA